jgi:hypothetical protein
MLSEGAYDTCCLDNAEFRRILLAYAEDAAITMEWWDTSEHLYRVGNVRRCA